MHFLKIKHYNITKIQRSNIFIENYNKYINDSLRHLSIKKEKGKTNLSWPLFIGFIIYEEDKLKNEIINKLNNRIININKKILIHLI